MWKAHKKEMNSKAQFTPGFLSLDHAAEYADVSTKTMKRWLSRGLPHFQAGARTKVLIDPHDIRAFLTRQQVAQPNLNDLNEMMKEVMEDLSMAAAEVEGLMKQEDFENAKIKTDELIKKFDANSAEPPIEENAS